MRAKRLHSLVPAGFVVALAVAGCNSILGLNQLSIGEQDAGTNPPRPDGPGAADVLPDNYVGECLTNAECTDRATAEAGALPDGSMPVVPAVCVRPEARCVELLTEDCTEILGDYKDDDAILLGTLFSTVGGQRDQNIERKQSATLAAEQINAVGGIPAPPSGGKRQRLVVLSCNEADPAGTPAGTVLKRAGAHLTKDLHVPAIVGPNTSQDTIELSNAVNAAQGGTLLLTPTAVAAQIAELVDNDLTWLMVPSDQQRGPLMINQINQLESELKAVRNKSVMKLGIIYRDDAVGLGTLRSLSGLIFNGAPLNAAINQANVSIDGYQFSAPNQDPIVNKYIQFAPDIIVLAGLAEVITTVMNPIEQRWSDAGSDRAYYVLTDQVKGPNLLASISLPNIPNLRPRVRGTGLTPGAESVQVQTAFEVSYRARYGMGPTASGSGPSYDSTYAIAYALAATRDLPVSGDAISKGLRKLAGSTNINVGPDNLLMAFGKLTAGENINAIGTYLPMEWDDKGAVVNGTIEIWCVTLPQGATMPAYMSSGLTYDIKTSRTMGAYVQCP